jgi:hypothetical protein
MRINTQLRALSASELEGLLRRLMLADKKMKEEGKDRSQDKPGDDSWIWNKEK